MKKTLILLVLILISSCGKGAKNETPSTFGEEPVELPSMEGQPNI